jgi:hypothetical protein
MKNITKKLSTTFVFLLFFLLVLKNPYSTRNLVANLEPFPDSQHYITAPLCFLNRGEWTLCRLNNVDLEGSKPSVPPLYSISILPSLFINNDPRTVYFTNLFFALISLVLLRKLLNTLFKNFIITDIVSIFLITNYFFYWVPTLAMAENLFLPLFFFGVYLLTQKTSKRNLFFAGLVTVSFYGHKYAFAPITLTYGISYGLKIILEYWKNKKELLKNIGIYLLSGILIIPLFFDIQKLFYFSSGLANKKVAGVSGGGAFSLAFFNKHLPEYLKPLLGQTQRFLWDFTPLLPQWLAKLSILGLLVSIFEKKKRLISFFLISSTIMQLLFISTFYVVDTRYVYNFLPTLLIGFAFLLDLIRKKLVFSLPFFKEAKHNYTFYIISFVLLAYYLIPLAPTIKKQIGLNLKYTETPWWKVSVDEMNIFFKEENNNYLITLASPYFLDYYSNQNYQPLPLNEQQDFHGKFKQIWEEGDYSNLTKLYQSKLDNHNVYVTNYGINGADIFRSSFKNIEENFTLTEVHTGCHKLCNIYQLSIKEETN